MNLPTVQEPPATGAAPSADGLRRPSRPRRRLPRRAAASSVPSAVAAVEATPRSRAARRPPGVEAGDGTAAPGRASARRAAGPSRRSHPSAPVRGRPARTPGRRRVARGAPCRAAPMPRRGRSHRARLRARRPVQAAGGALRSRIAGRAAHALPSDDRADGPRARRRRAARRSAASPRVAWPPLVSSVARLRPPRELVLSQSPQKILVAPAWPYASGPRHIGHVAGFAVPADVFARYHRLKGNDVLMVSGTDEHGTPVMVSADRSGVSPRELADRNNALIREDLRDLGISYDNFTRTTTRNHHRGHAGHLPDALRQGLPRRADDARRVLPLDGPHPARPLHRGDVPDLRLSRGARRPVRQLRQPARPRRPDRPALDHRRLDAGVPRDEAPLPRPAGVRGAARANGSRRRTTGGRT